MRRLFVHVAMVMAAIGCGESKKCGEDSSTPSAASTTIKTEFERPPYILHLNIPRSPETFFLVGIHSKPDLAIVEANYLDEVYEVVSRQTGTTEALILGDMNLSCDYASPDDLAGLDMRKDQKYIWHIDDTADTNVAASTCAYDRVVSVGGITKNGVVTGIEKGDGGISDHYPVRITFQDRSIVAWNIKQFGTSKANDYKSIQTLANTICLRDLVLLQEVIDDDGSVVKMIERTVKENCPTKSFTTFASEPLGTTSYKERYVYFVYLNHIRAFQYEDPKVPLESVTKFGLLDGDEQCKATEDSATPSSSAGSGCGSSPYKTSGGYCYATKDGRKVRVANSCCG